MVLFDLTSFFLPYVQQSNHLPHTHTHTFTFSIDRKSILHFLYTATMLQITEKLRKTENVCVFVHTETH